MTSECHSVVRAPAARVTRLDDCCTTTSDACAYATTESFVDIALTRTMQDRQDALQLNANGDICVDKPKEPIDRWYEAVITFCGVDPELFNIVSNEPLVLDDAETPVAIGWSSEQGSIASANFALEFWTGTGDDCDAEGNIVYGYGILPCMRQGYIGDVTFENGVVNFTVNAITKFGSNWGVGPYNVSLSRAAATLGQPIPLLTPIGVKQNKRFFWTELPPPPGDCGCMSLAPELEAAPLAGASPLDVTFTLPLDEDGVSLPGYLDPGDASGAVFVAAGATTYMHSSYAAPGNYTATFATTAYSAPSWTSQTIVVS